MGLPLFFFFSIIFFLSSLNASVAGAIQSSTSSSAAENPFTAKASLIRYWNKQITNNLPKPSFLLSKASPLNAVESSLFTKLATDKNALSSRLQSFCSSANLFCFPDVAPSLEKHDSSVDFSLYDDKNFTNYGTSQLRGTDSFKNYSSSEFENMAVNSFRRYSRDSKSHDDKFSTYSTNANIPDDSFHTYGAGATGGSGDFKHYNDESVNVASLRFITYETNANRRKQDFSSYAVNTNAGSGTFVNYGKKGSGIPTTFTNYGNDTNVLDSNFTSYGESGNGANDSFTSYGYDGNVPNSNFRSYGDSGNGANDSFTTYGYQGNVPISNFRSYGKSGSGANDSFTSYGSDSNVPVNDFRSYGESGNGTNDSFTSYGDNGNVPTNNFASYGEGENSATTTFSSYRDQSNVGDDSFQSYAKGSGKVDFTNYGNSFNEGTDTFKGYGKGSVGKTIGFKIYGVNNTFKDYSKKGITFASYRNQTSKSTKSKVRIASKWVEPGKFFRESMLKGGTVMPMPDIRDKMPRRSFLPRSIVSKLPFSSSQISALKEIFHAEENSSMATILQNTIEECEGKPSRGETKRCVGSVEDMIDFAVSVLGHNVVVRSTENVEGSKQDVMIGTVKGINGGRVTQSVSCHQSLFPYLVYYCHSVPKVRVHQADLLDPKTEVKINHGVAICHIDTSAWSPTHGAFLALGSKPGRIEVCHWIFENDMTWATAD